MSDLLPCPFCGGPVEIEETESTRDRMYGERHWWGVVCRNTINRGGSCAIQQRPSASKEAAIDRWNRRAQPAPITPETGNALSQGASAITSETVQTDDLTEQLRKVAKRAGTPAEHNCDCGRKWKHTTYGWVATEPAQAVPLLSAMEAVRIGAKHSTGLSHTREFTEEGFLACVAEVEQAVRAKLGAGVPQWIACVDAMPPKNTEVLIKFRDTPLPSTGQHTASPFDNDGWCYPKENDPEEVGPVTHWMPLPPPPGIVGKEGGNV